MSPKTQEKRRFKRLVKSLPIRISLTDTSLNERFGYGDYEVMAHNISEGGLFAELNIPEEKFINSLLSKVYKIDLELRLPEKDVSMLLKAEPVWTKPSDDPIDNRIGCGFKFVDIKENQRNRISSYISELERVPPLADIETFTLLVDGKDLDTGIYEYFPYSEKAILDFKTAYKIILQLKKGLRPAGYKDYIYAKYSIGNEDTNQKAIEAAYKASQIFGNFSLDKRRKIVGNIHDLLVAHRDKLIELLVIEGHSVKLAQWEFSGMERCFNKETLDFYTSEMWKEIKSGDETIHVVRKADGVVCLCPPKNASCSNSLLAALVFLAGNTIIVKPPLKMPLSTIYMWKNVVNEALKRNEAPDGCVNIVLGNSKKIMDEWLESPLVNDIIYFGESSVGLEIGRRAYLNNKKAILELSGNDMLFVWKDADIEKATSALLDAFLGSTQICMVPKNAIIHKDVYEPFVESLLKKVSKLKVGLPSSRETYFTPVVKPQDFFDFLNDALQKGAKLACGGRKIDHNGTPQDNGIYIEPTLLRIEDEEKAGTMRVIQEENFFPLIPLVKVSGNNDDEIFDKMKRFSDRNQYGLRTSVWVKSDKYQKRFINEIRNSGLLRINSRHVGFSMYTSTHGGTGRTGGPYGEMNYVWQRTSHLQGIVVRKG